MSQDVHSNFFFFCNVQISAGKTFSSHFIPMLGIDEEYKSDKGAFGFGVVARTW